MKRNPVYLFTLLTVLLFQYSNANRCETLNGQITNITISDSINPVMILVDSGSFVIGALAATDFHQQVSTNGNHRVMLSTFKIGKYEVTQAEWKAVMGTNLSFHQRCDDCPVEEVSWNDVQLFILKLNEKTGLHYALPTSAQWEFAARGGMNDKGYSFSGSDEIDRIAWYGKEFSDKTHPVGRKTPNQLGIYDMTGNVAELCSDWFEQFPNATQNNPQGPASGTGHIMRGGSWGMNAEECGVLISRIIYPDDRNAHVGFRLVLLP